MIAVPNETLASVAYQKLRQDLIAGVFQFGRPLKLRTLIERYGIGAAPTREALSRVVQEGLIEYQDQKGFIVTALCEDDLDDLLRLRILLNEFALREAIVVGDVAWEEEIVLAHYRMSRIPFDPRAISLEWEACHRAFHAALLAACRSKRGKKLCEQLFDAASRYRSLSRISVARNGRSDEHRAIMEATVARDGETAVRLLREHFSNTADHCRAELRRRRQDGSTGNEMCS